MDNNDIKLIQLGSYVRPEVKEVHGREWVLNGDKNSYPQYVIDRRIGSPTNGSIIEVFCELLYGKGLSVNGSNEVYKELSEIFPKREQRKCLDDFQTFGYYFMQILRGKSVGGDSKNIAKIMHLPAAKVGRDKMDSKGGVNGAWYCDDWTNTYKNKPEFIKEFKGQLTDARMVKSVVPYQQGQDYFALPSYVQGLQYAEMEEEISNYCINHIKNGLSFGYIINFNNGGNLTPEQKNDVESMIKKKLIGSSNAGKFILSFNDSKEAEVTVVPLEISDAHNQWEFLTKEARQQIITSHGAFPNLFGISTSGGLGNNADELDVQSKLVQDYQINPKQDFFIDELAELLEINGLETDLVFIPLRETYKSTESQEENPTDETVDENKTKDLKLAGFNPNQKRGKDGKWTSDISSKKSSNKLNNIIRDKLKYSYEDKPLEVLGSEYYTIQINGKNIQIRISDHLPDLFNVENSYDNYNIEYFINISKEVSGGSADSLSSINNFYYEGLEFSHLNLNNFSDKEDLINGIISEIKYMFRGEAIQTLEMSKHICLSSNNAEKLIKLGETISDEWDLIDDRRCDEITLSEVQLNTVIQLAQVPKTSKKSSEQDTSIFKIRYKYAGNKKGEREFCNKVLRANKVYRAEDLNANYNYNEDFAPEGEDSYNIFMYKGGVNCRHFWQRVIYLKKGNNKISVNQARKIILALEPDDRADAKWQNNEKEVVKPAEPKNNWWSLKPNYRNSGVTPTKK